MICRRSVFECPTDSLPECRIPYAQPLDVVLVSNPYGHVVDHDVLNSHPGAAGLGIGSANTKRNLRIPDRDTVDDGVDVLLQIERRLNADEPASEA